MLTVSWRASEIERWIFENPYQNIKINSYTVTIFPAETTKNYKTRNAKLSTDNNDPEYSVWFKGLQVF